MEPVLEELPKWDLLLQVLQEIEETMLEQPLPARESGHISDAIHDVNLTPGWQSQALPTP